MKQISTGFCLLFFLLVGCSKSPQELFTEAEKWVAKDSLQLALKGFQTVVESFPEDSLAPVSQYRIARLYLDRANDMDQGLEALKVVIDNYPQSPQAAQARKDIADFPEWVYNRAESIRAGKRFQDTIHLLSFLIDRYPDHPLAPKSQYLIGDIYMNDIRDFQSALEAYRKVLNLFPGSKQEAHAQFMLGYIYANVLNDLDQARTEYETFLKRFPKSELAPSVKFELEYLGKDINEIPQLKHIAS
ncbi:MAG: outer membrane protein assembly factor BamD [Candidatus Neomarinimicrobiota bacterium]|nr:MAG: outer membrane protein assembly factor BamD [Candidatus Neomarinimicrobiota bacterium]